MTPSRRASASGTCATAREPPAERAARQARLRDASIACAAPRPLG
jgi:hypothetical protein